MPSNKNKPAYKCNKRKDKRKANSIAKTMEPNLQGHRNAAYFCGNMSWPRNNPTQMNYDPMVSLMIICWCFYAEYMTIPFRYR